MTIKRNIRIATVAAVAAAALGAGISTPAMALTPTTSTATTLSSGPITPTVKLTWSQCWRLAYFSARDDGLSMGGASAEADLTCGRSPEDF